LIAAALLAAQLTVNDIVAVHPATGYAPSAFTWSPDGSRYIYSVPPDREKAAPALRIHVVASGSDRLVFAAKSESRGSRSRPIAQIVWSNDSRRIAFLNDGALHVANADGSNDRVLAADADDPQWSPDDTHLGYVHDNNLYSVDAAGRGTVQLTRDGSTTRINGDPDWLYSEEMLSVQHAYAWSPKGDAIAYLSFDESPIVPFPIQNFLTTVNTVEMQRYPLAGGKNPRVQLRVVDVASRASRTLYDGGPHDDYVLNMTWTPDGREVVDNILDRAQQHFALVAFTRSGASRTILRESNPQFYDVDDVTPPKWLDRGRSFLWISQRGNVQALYRVDTATGNATRLTGDYAVGSVLQVDQRAGVAYVSAYYASRRDLGMLRVPLRGGNAVNLTPGAGRHTVVMPQRGDAYIETDSEFNTPPTIALRHLGSAQSVSLFRTPDLRGYDLGSVRRLEIPSKWGNLDAQLVVPKGFDPSKKYPVVVEAYSGPLPVSWGVESDDHWLGLFPYLMTQHGFLYFVIDGPASRNDRVANSRMFYKQMGAIAMQGPLMGADWLRSQPYVDGAHIGLWGWSYGGYLTAYTLTHAPDAFQSGLSGAPPADWRYYDTGYTERYMGKPQDNAAAYQRTSVLPAAKNLKAKMLLLQGTSDDNVHLMNSISLIQAFMSAGKHVDYYVYPGARHGPTGIAPNRDRLQRTLDWFESTLK
jgi:dipeptidyl-peptidase-4